MATPDRKEVIRIIEEKIDELKRTASRYNIPFTLNLSYDGVGFKIETNYNKAEEKPNVDKEDKVKLTPEEKKIYAKLKQLSTFVMQNCNYHYPYLSSQVIFTITKEKPSTLKQLINVKGIGEKKLESIGEACLAIVNGKDIEEVLELVELPETDKGELLSTLAKAAKNMDMEKEAIPLGDWKPSPDTLTYYKTNPVLNDSLFGRWCLLKGYKPQDVISGKIKL